MSKAINFDQRGILVVIPQWRTLSDAERAWFLSHPLVAKREREKAAHVKRERVVRAYARVKVDLRFGGGINREYELLPAGTVLEVLQPDDRDRQDIERQAKLDQKQLVVLRWQGRAILLPGSTIERAEKVDFERGTST